jgi:hypothetical protein
VLDLYVKHLAFERRGVFSAIHLNIVQFRSIESCGNGGEDETFSLLQLCDFAALGANKAFLHSLAEPIAKCDTSLLTSRDQMLSFYGNLVTMLTLHSVLWHCEHTSEPSELVRLRTHIRMRRCLLF